MEPFITIPTWSPSKLWHSTTFDTREQYKEFVKSLFKVPGKYNFDETSLLFNSEARRFEKDKHYTLSPRGSKDYRAYWRTEKEKCRKGVIFHNDKGDTWHLSRYYYHWINFLQITDKVTKKIFFPNIMDVQYHMNLFELWAELDYKHVIIVKKRQIASSYMHIGQMYNHYIFDTGFIGKVGASAKEYINDEGTWKFLNEYRDFNNEHTGWYRPNFPEKPMNWKQQQEITTGDNKKVFKGTKAKLTGHTFDKKPTSGLGGPCFRFFYEEAGEAETLDKTYGYMQPAMEFGMLTTGVFIAAGSVGQLKNAQCLYKYFKNPEANNFMSVENNLMDKNGTVGRTGLFIPEQWGMPPCMDQYGNSLVKEALILLEEKFAQMKIDKAPEDYQLYVSQHPRNVEEAFAIRTVSIFPIKYTSKQVKRLEDGEIYLRNVELERNDRNEIVVKDATREPMQYPSSKNIDDKRGCIVVHEEPIKNADWGTYLGSIDPVEGGDTDSSESLASIYIWKVGIEVTRIDSEGNSKTFIEGNKIVAFWTGRYSDPNETNEQMSLLIEWYNAKTTCEKNKPGFISYMQQKKRQKYLAHINEMIFDKEYEDKDNTFMAYGWYNTPALWNKILEYGIDSLSEELMTKHKTDGTIDRIIYGVERIPDIWLLREMQNYNAKGNFDRIISYCALIAFAKRQEIIMGIKKRIERPEDKLKDTRRISSTLEGKKMFHNIGNTSGNTSFRSNRSFVRNLK